MGTAAKLNRVATHIYHTNGVTILFAEQGHCAHCLCLIDGHLPNIYGVTLQNSTLNDGINTGQLLRCYCGVVREVKTQTVGLYQRTGLMHMIAQHALQCLLQQVGCGVSTHNALPTLHINGRANNVIDLDRAAAHCTAVEISAALVLLDIGYLKTAVANQQHTVVSCLTAHFRIEGSLIQHDHTLLAACDRTGNLFADAHSGNLCFAVVDIVAHKLSSGNVRTEINTCPAQVSQCLTSLTGTNTLFLTASGEALHIYGHALILQHFRCQVNGESVGICQQEGIVTGEYILALSLMLCQLFTEDTHTGINGTGKILFFILDHLDHVLRTLTQVGIVALIFLNDSADDFKQEGLVHAQELAVTGSTTEQTAQHVATAFVGGLNTVSDHEGRCANMVCDHAQAHICLDALAVGCAGNGSDVVGDVHNRIHIKQAIYILAHNSETLQAHAGIDVLLYQLCIIAVTVIIELGEHVVPDFHIAVALTADLTVGAAATVLLATVIVHLRARTAGTGAVLPEVVLLAKAEDPICCDTDLLVPDIEGLIVIFVDGRIQTVLLQANDLCQKLPAPGNCFSLKVITKGEVTKHFEVCAMTGSLTDILDVTGTNTLLASTDSAARGLNLSLEIRLHGRHAGIDQQQGRIILRNQGKAGQAQMLLAFKEAEKHLTQFVYTISFFTHRI